MQRMGRGYSDLRGGFLTRQAGIGTLLAVALLATSFAEADEGNHGVLFVHGALTEGACRLDMASAYQDVWLGETTTGSLARVGERTKPVAFQLRLRDCLRMGGAIQDARLGNRVWDAYQPAVTVSFNAPFDADNAQLVKVRGAGGAGTTLAGWRQKGCAFRQPQPATAVGRCKRRVEFLRNGGAHARAYGCRRLPGSD